MANDDDIEHGKELIVGKKPRPQHKRVEPVRTWVKAKVIAEMFGVSLTAVYKGECGMDRIRSARIPGAGRKRQARRFYFPDAEKLSREMLAQTEREEIIPAGILRLMGGAWRRR